MVDTDWTGEEKFYDQYGEDTFVEIATRLADTPIQETDHRRRKVAPSYFVSNTLEDPFEALQMLVDPKSTYMQAKVAGKNRKIDKIIIDALEGTAKSGKTGSTDKDLASANKVLVQGAGLTKEKLLEAHKILNAFEIPKNDRSFIVSAEQLEDLLNTTEVASADYNTVRTLIQGEVGTFAGFNFIHSEQLSTDGSSDRLCYAFQKGGLQLAIQKDAEGRVTERPDKNYAWQVYMRITLGAVRLDERYVVQVACDES